MKIGCITTHYANNYGAILQTYALQQVLNEEFHQDAEVISFYPYWHRTSWHVFEKGKSVRVICRNLRKALHVQALIGKEKRLVKMERFIAGNIKRGEKEYYSSEEISKNPPQYDCYVCGSDQIWNTKLRVMPTFFMDFTRGIPEARKFSYAPSVAEPIVPEAESFVASCLSNLDLISVREKEDISVLQAYTSKPIVRVVDPVFLLTKDQWNTRLPEQSKRAPYLFCYFIGNEKLAWPVVKQLERLTGYQIIYLANSGTFSPHCEEIISDADPFEFVSLIRDAALVCTNSFHCTALSAIFEKDFFITAQNEKRKTRMENVIEDCGLDDRFLDIDAVRELKVADIPVNYSEKRLRLNKLRQEAYAYIAQGLGVDIPNCPQETVTQTSEKRAVRLAAHENCTGCGVCAACCPTASINMLEGKLGFLYPQIDTEKCIGCGRCVSVCPALNKRYEERHLWKKLYAARVKDNDSLKESTSGGIATLLSQKVLEDGGVVVGACMSDDMVVRHIVATSHEDLDRIRKSKYVQSNLEGIYFRIKEYVASGKQVLFIGTPCQVDAINSYFGDKHPDNLILCDLLCHAVPSPGVFRAYIGMLQKENNAIVKKYEFRSKIHGNSASCYIEFSNGDRHYAQHIDDPWHSLFGRYLSIRSSCYHCQYRSRNRVSDITLGDFWKVERFYENLDAKTGVSRLFISTQKGEQLVASVKDRFEIWPVDIDESLKNTKRILESPQEPIDRARFIEDHEKMSTKQLFRKYKPASKYVRAVMNRIVRLING